MQYDNSGSDLLAVSEYGQPIVQLYYSLDSTGIGNRVFVVSLLTFEQFCDYVMMCCEHNLG
jgi:hypothetical protein